MAYKIINDCRGLYEEEILQKIMKSRGIDDYYAFVYPSEDNFIDYDELPNINKAYNEVLDALINRKKIAVLFDTDTDGISSGTIITRYLRRFGGEVTPFINSGKAHGLIRTENYYAKLKDFNLLIIVDSLNSTVDEYRELSDSGVKIVVLDHHNVNPEIPYDKYITLVTSQTTYPNKELCGAGVTWKFCKYFDYLQSADFADDLVDLAACGELADVMSMMNMENRYIVAKGLRNLQNLAMKKIVGSYEFNSTAVLFSVAPLVNATNRLNHNEDIMNAFLSDDNKEVLKYMRSVKKCKKDQDEMVDALMTEAEKQCDAQVDDGRHVLFAILDTEGLSGLIAMKITSKYGRPAFVIGLNGKRKLAGSLRTGENMDLSKLVNDSGLAEAVGHPQAAGFTIPVDNLDKFVDYMETQLQDMVIDDSVVADVLINPEDLTFKLEDLVHELDYISGKDFKAIKFLVKNIKDYTVSTMKDGKHLKISTNGLDVIKWNSTYDVAEFEDAELFDTPITAFGTVSMGGFKDVKLQLIADDIEIEED